MKYMHLYTTPDGESHIEEVAVELDKQGAGFPIKQIGFGWLPAGDFNDWHCEIAASFIITLSGATTNVASDGSRATVSAGKVILVEDVFGKGHQSNVDKSADRLLMSARLRLEEETIPTAENVAAAIRPPVTKPPLRIPRLYTTTDGGTTFGELEIIPRSPGAVVPGFRPDLLRFASVPAGTRLDWHPEGARRLVVTLSGEAEVVATDGVRRRFSAGEVFLAEDEAGKGHQLNIGDSNEWTALLVSLVPEAE